MLEVLYHHAKFGGAQISPAAGAERPKNAELFMVALCHRADHYIFTL